LRRSKRELLENLLKRKVFASDPEKNGIYSKKRNSHEEKTKLQDGLNGIYQKAKK